MIPRWLPRSRGLAGVLAAGMCVSISVLSWFGYRAIREWQRSSMLLVERRTDEAADLLVTALTHDMRAVQKSVLPSADWDVFMLTPPYDVSNVAAGAFARYPYPEAFFAGRGTVVTGFRHCRRRSGWRWQRGRFRQPELLRRSFRDVPLRRRTRTLVERRRTRGIRRGFRR